MAEARTKISLELLAQFLDLPEGTKILAIYPTNHPDVMEMRLSHPSLPEVKEGQDVPFVVVTYRSRCFAEYAGWEVR